MPRPRSPAAFFRVLLDDRPESAFGYEIDALDPGTLHTAPGVGMPVLIVSLKRLAADGLKAA